MQQREPGAEAAHEQPIDPALLDQLLIESITHEEPEDPAGELSAEELAAIYVQMQAHARDVLEQAQHDQTLLDGLFGEADAEGAPTPEVEEEDFDIEQRPIFRALRSHLRALVAKNTRDKQRMGELNWMMGPFPDRHGLRFEDACRSLYCRPSIVRTRALYEMWRVGIAVPEPLSPLAKGIPRFLLDELEMNPRTAHLRQAGAMARLLWLMPGRPLEEFFNACHENGVVRAPQTFDVLELEGFVAKVEHLPSVPVYFVARNPTQMPYARRNQFSWAQSMAMADD